MITRPCYSNRDEVMRAPDFKDSLLTTAQVDRALQSAADNIDGELHRHFYPYDGTLYFSWPNYQYAEPWKLRLDRHDLQCLTLLQSPGNGGGSGGQAIPLWQVFLEPVNKWRGFCYTRIELDRSSGATWNPGATPQHSVWATGTWAFTADADQVAVLASGVNASVTTLPLGNGALAGAGDVVIIGYGRGDAPFPAYPGTAGAIAPYVGERCIVQDKAAADTGLAQSGAGCSTAGMADNILATTGDGTLNAGEVLLLDAERMLVEMITPAGAVVKRAWDGTVLAPHSGAEVWAYRNLTVLRGELGTAAASWTEGTAVWKHRVPQLVADLSIAEASNQVAQEVALYSRTVGTGEGASPAPGVALIDKWDECRTRFGRKARSGAI